MTAIKNLSAPERLLEIETLKQELYHPLIVMPHPNKFLAGKGKSLYDYIEWMRVKSMKSGQERIIGIMRNIKKQYDVSGN